MLIGTLYCGENEFDKMKKSLRDQSYPHWEHFVLKNLPNKEAHDRLYRTFMDRSSNYDLFLKLDADMVLSSSDSLQRIVALFKRKSDLDHAILGVHDWASDSVIIGVHAYSNRAVWEASHEQLFVDYSPQIPGKRLVVDVPPSPLIHHSPDPSPYQAFEFGVHRALKVVQRGSRKLELSRSRTQWNLLKDVWQRFRGTGIRRLGLTLHGAECVFQGEVVRRDYDATDDRLASIFERRIASDTATQLRERLSLRWESPLDRERRYLRMIGGKRIMRAACKEVPKRLLVGMYKQMSSQHIIPDQEVEDALRSEGEAE